MLRLIGLVMLGLFSACFSVREMCSTMYQVSVECCVGAVAPGSETVTTSFTGRSYCFRPVFCYFGVLFILPRFQFLQLSCLVAWV